MAIVFQPCFLTPVLFVSDLRGVGVVVRSESCQRYAALDQPRPKVTPGAVARVRHPAATNFEGKVSKQVRPRPLLFNRASPASEFSVVPLTIRR